MTILKQQTLMTVYLCQKAVTSSGMIKRFVDQTSIAESQVRQSMIWFSASQLQIKTGTQTRENSCSYKI